MATGVRGCMTPRGIVTHAVPTAAAARSPLLRAPSLAAVATPPRHVTSPVSLQPSARRSLTRWGRARPPWLQPVAPRLRPSNS